MYSYILLICCLKCLLVNIFFIKYVTKNMNQWGTISAVIFHTCYCLFIIFKSIEARFCSFYFNFKRLPRGVYYVSSVMFSLKYLNINKKPQDSCCPAWECIFTKTFVCNCSVYDQELIIKLETLYENIKPINFIVLQFQ